MYKMKQNTLKLCAELAVKNQVAEISTGLVKTCV